MNKAYRVISFGQQMGIGVAGSCQVTISAVAKCNKDHRGEFTAIQPWSLF